FHGARPDAAAPAVPPLSPAAAAPRAPQNVQESGLSLLTLCNLILKHLYLTGHLLGAHVARELRLPFAVVDEALKLLKEERCIEVGSGDLLGPASYRFNLTEQGRVRAREAFEQSRYVGPAPVALADYQAQCRRQTITGMSCSSDSLRDAFSHLIIRPSLLEEVGPAVCSGRSIFVYGPPGNGKTVIAKGLGQLLNRHGGEIFVPYALFAENSIVTLFDPTIHQTTDNADASAPAAADAERTAGHLQRLWDENAPDLRWRRVRRPVVITGGELTLDMLDLRYNRESNYYTAPMHIKANGGVFLIDDFGRQIVSPRDLLNRWILPLEERIDYLTLATGKKFAVPFEQLIIFSTNLDPRELVDEAFLRRIRHKIAVGPPNRDLYTRIFETCCRERQIAFSPEAVAFLYETYYINGKDPRSSDPRDLLEIVQAICRYRNQSVHLTADLMAEAGRRFFCQI
ncbi:MAG: ATPase, partial [Planctomycetaceae bacterium]